MSGLTQRYHTALNTTFMLHGADTRKGDGTPYLGHLLAVSALVMEHGGDEDTAIAALLHDALEDKENSRGFVSAFGPKVLQIVEECSDTQTRPKPDWTTRKEKKLASLPQLLPEARLVLACDNLHNLRALDRAVRKKGLEAFACFRPSIDEKLWQVETFALNLLSLDENDLTTQLYLEAQVLVKLTHQLLEAEQRR